MILAESYLSRFEALDTFASVPHLLLMSECELIFATVVREAKFHVLY